MKYFMDVPQLSLILLSISTIRQFLYCFFFSSGRLQQMFWRREPGVSLGLLKSFGFGQSALNWLKSYLSFRCQKVVSESGESSLVNLCNGVPQGSILGQLLFTIFINDISNIIINCLFPPAWGRHVDKSQNYGWRYD